MRQTFSSFRRGLALCMFLLATTSSQAQEIKTGRIAGQVIDRSTQAPLPGVSIRLEGTTTGASTNTDGHFALEQVVVGTHRLRISCIGYATQQHTDVVVSTGHATQVLAELEESTFQMSGEVVVTGSAFWAPRELATSAYGLNYEEIRRQPGAAGDVSRMIQAMPGVVPTNDQRNDLVVRGGSPGENLTLVDNVEVDNISHFGTQGASGGPITMLNAEFIREANFTAGGFPASFGDRLSSVLDIRLRDGNRERLSGTFDLGLAGAGFLFEGPISSRGAWMVAAHKSYLDLLAGSFGMTAVPNYTNYQAKATYDIGTGHRLWFVALGGVDDIHFVPDQSKTDDPEVLDIVSNGWRAIEGVNWRWLWGNSGYGTLGISDMINVFGQDIKDPRLPGRPVVFSNDSREGVSTIKYDAVLHAGAFDLSAGISHKVQRARYLIASPTGEDTPYSSDSTKISRPGEDGSLSTSQSAAYAQASVSPLPGVDITAGLRWDRYAFTGKDAVSPRAAVKYALHPALTISASWGIFHQQPALVLLNAYPSNNTLEPIRAEHYIAGVSWLARPDLKISVEGFRKEYTAYPVSSEFPTLSMANDGDNYTVAGRLIPLVSEGRGTAEGVEFFLQQKLTDALYGQVSYTLSRVRHRALDGIERPGSFDIPHVLYLIGGYRASDSWEFSSKFSYASGRPGTPFLMPDSYSQNRWIWDASRVNTIRMPDYSRLDVRVDNRYHFSGWNLVTYVELQNVYGRRNLFMYVWNEKTRDKEAVYQTGVFFYGGVKIEF